MFTTDLFGYTVTNFGPLTTTFTAAPSCATDTRHLVIAQAKFPDAFYFDPFCPNDAQASSAYIFNGCLPSAAQWNDEYVRALKTGADDYIYPYYSPGVHCPAGWATVGMAARATGAGTGDLSVSGIFTGLAPTPTISSSQGPEAMLTAFNPFPNVLRNALEPGETAVVCCPR